MIENGDIHDILAKLKNHECPRLCPDSWFLAKNKPFSSMK